MVDATASNLYVMPGLIEYHSHLQKDFGEAQGRAWLAFGITTVRSPGNTPYEGGGGSRGERCRRPSGAAGLRHGLAVRMAADLLQDGHRDFEPGPLRDGTPAHQGSCDLDLLKSYVRLPDLQQKRMVEFAHSIGIPVATHEIYPAAFVGVDSTEHTGATSRRGYSPKIATLQQSYQDVIQLFGKSGRILCPMIFAGPGESEAVGDGAAHARGSAVQICIRSGCRMQVAHPAAARGGGRRRSPTPASGKMVMDVMKAGGISWPAPIRPMASIFTANWNRTCWPA